MIADRPGRGPVVKSSGPDMPVVVHLEQLGGHGLLVVRVARRGERRLGDLEQPVGGPERLHPLLAGGRLVRVGELLAVSPVSEDLYGMYGPHQESVAMLLTRSPSASVSAGNSSTLATVASFGLKPCWAACFQNVLKSGGSGALVKNSRPWLLNLLIIEV